MSIRYLIAFAVAFLLLPTSERSAVAQEGDAGSHVTVQRVWSGIQPDFSISHPSPDGRYVTNMDDDSGDLEFIDLVSGERSRVGVKDGGWQDMSWAQYSVFSPDGDSVAFVWYSAPPAGLGNPEDQNYLGYSIQMIPATGGEPRVLVPAGTFHYAVLDDWAADGRYLLARIWYADERFCLCRIRTADGTIEPIPGIPPELNANVGSQRISLSPDGNYVAFDVPVSAADRDVYVASVGAGNARPLLEGQASDRLMGWLPDGSGLLFYSDRGATRGIWVLPLGSNASAGEPRLLRPDVWRAEPLGFSRDAFYYGVTVESAQVYSGAIDTRSGGYRAPAGAVQEGSDGNSFNGEFSPDGRYIAYARNREGGKYDIIVRAVGGDDVRIFESDYQRSPIGWTSDSREVLLNAVIDDSGRFGLERLDLATGEATTMNVASNPGRNGLVSHDGRVVYSIQGDGAGGTEIVALDLDDGSRRSIAPTTSPGSLSLSPDGQTFAVLDGDPVNMSYARIYTLPVTGGEPNIIYEMEGDFTGSDLALGAMAGIPWTADGERVLFIQGGAIMRVPAGGGAAEKVVDLPVKGRHNRFRLHPDGSRFLINAGVDKGEIWIVKGLPGMLDGPGTSDH